MKKVISVIVVVLLFVILSYGLLQMRPFGEPEKTEMDDHFLEDSQPHGQINNVVTAVLFDYRGLDTLGEATILFSAVSGILTVLRKFKESDTKEGDDEPER